MGRRNGIASSGVSASVLWIAFAAGIVAAGMLWMHVRNGDAGNVPQADRMKLYSSLNGNDGAGRWETTQAARRTDGATEILPRNPAVEEEPHEPPASGKLAESSAETSGSLTAAVSSQPLKVRVYLSKEKKTETVALEAYVSGVVAAEMPLSFEPAALEAQALAARTYIMRRLRLQPDDGIPLGADVTDTTAHQVYRSASEMKRLKESDQAAWGKAVAAARRTAGLVIAYEGEPIEALYFASGNGYTESSGEVFAGDQPYLQAIASPWDKDAPGITGRSVELSLPAFYAKMGVKTSSVIRLLTGWPAIRVLERTDGKRVKRLGVGDKVRTGEEVRQRLGLSSTDFSWTVKNGKIRFAARGSGHGVGMSQWGAQGMAQTGKTAREIIAYYYSGTSLMEASKLPDK